MLTDRGDLVIDPFAGSCVTGEVCERLRRRWLCIEKREDYLKGALGRFEKPLEPQQDSMFSQNGEGSLYKIHHPAALWEGAEDPLPQDGGKVRTTRAARRR